MRPIWLAVVFLFLSLNAPAAEPLNRQTPPFKITVEDIWKPKKESKVQKGDQYLMSFAPNGSGVLVERGNIFDIASNEPVLAKALPGLTDAEFTSDGVLLAVVGEQMGYVLAGKVKLGLKLPAENFRLSRGKGDAIYLYGKVDDNDWAIYKYVKGGDYVKFLEIQERIAGVTEGDDGLYFAVRNSIYQAVPGKPLKLVFVSPFIKKIDAIGYDSSNNRLYFSCEKGFFLLQESRLARLIEDVRGEIKMADRLYLRDSVTGKVYAVSD